MSVAPDDLLNLACERHVILMGGKGMGREHVRCPLWDNLSTKRGLLDATMISDQSRLNFLDPTFGATHLGSDIHLTFSTG